MARLAYPVVVREVGAAVGASVPDFRRHVVGANAADAVANAENIVKKVLEDCERRGTAPPTPSSITVAHIELSGYNGPLPASALRPVDRT